MALSVRMSEYLRLRPSSRLFSGFQSLLLVGPQKLRERPPVDAPPSRDVSPVSPQIRRERLETEPQLVKFLAVLD